MDDRLPATADEIDAAWLSVALAPRFPGVQVSAIEVLEHIGTPAAKDHLRALAGGAAGAELTRAAAEALKRLDQR